MQQVRDFIHSALYHPETGYFSTKPNVVGALEKPLMINSLSGEATCDSNLYIPREGLPLEFLKCSLVESAVGRFASGNSKAADGYHLHFIVCSRNIQ